MPRSKPTKRVFIGFRFRALSNGSHVRLKAQPLEILEQRALVLRTASQPVVVFNAKQDSAAERAGSAPHMCGMHDVAEVQVPCGRRSEARERARRQPPAECLEVHVHDAPC